MVVKTVVLFGIFLSCSEGHVSSETAPMYALVKHLFKDRAYHPAVRPTMNHSTPTTVKLEIAIIAVLGLDTKRQILGTSGFIRVTWRDEFLQWNSSKFEGLDNLVIPQTMIWRPDIIVNNVVSEHRHMGDENTRVRVSDDGTVRWEPGYFLETTCKVDVTKYPFDVNVCPIHFISWMSDNTSVKLEIGPNDMTLLSNVNNGEYFISTSPSKTHQFKAVSGLFYDQVLFNTKLTRRAGYFVLSLLMPVMLLSIMCSVSFILAPDEQDKLTVSITVLLSFTVFLGVIDNNLPETSDGISLIVIYVSAMLALGFIGVLGNVVIIKVHRWEEESQASSCNEDCTVRKFSETAKESNHPNIFLDESLIVNSQSEIQPRFKGGHTNQSVCCIHPRSRRIATVLNKLFLYLNGSVVIVLTIGIWILMLQ